LGPFNADANLFLPVKEGRGISFYKGIQLHRPISFLVSCLWSPRACTMRPQSCLLSSLRARTGADAEAAADYDWYPLAMKRHSRYLAKPQNISNDGCARCDHGTSSDLKGRVAERNSRRSDGHD